MVVRKILEATLVAGSTSVTFTDTDIPNSLLRVYCTRSALFPLSQTLSGNSVTVNYKPQDSNVGVALEIVKSGLDIVDDLESEDATKALSANQGYVLKGLIDGIVIPTVPENITDLDDVIVTSIQNGQVLAWNSTTEKFENVNQSGGGLKYTLNEQVVGTWFGETLYQKSFNNTSASDFVTPAIIAELPSNCRIKMFFGTVDGKRDLNSRIAEDNRSYTWVTTDEYRIANFAIGANYANKATLVTVQYTKTS